MGWLFRRSYGVGLANAIHTVSGLEIFGYRFTIHFIDCSLYCGYKYTMDDSRDENENLEKCRLAIDIHKTSNFRLLLPIYNNVVARKLYISHPNPQF